MTDSRSTKVYEFAQKALARIEKEIEKCEDDLTIFILEQTLKNLSTVFQNKDGAWQFVNLFLLPYWKDGKFDKDKLNKDSHAQLQKQVVQIITENPDLAEKLQNVEHIMEKAEKATEFLYIYFAAMCDFATTK